MMKKCGRSFVVYSPMVTFCEVVHHMNFDEGYPRNTVLSNSEYAVRNTSRNIIEGRWYELNELDKNNIFDYPVRAKFATPIDLIKMIDELRKSLNYNENNIGLIVEFVLNCENLANQVYDEETIFVPLTNTEKGNHDVNAIDKKDETPTAITKLKNDVSENKVKIVDGNGKLTKAKINTYDPKNKFKKSIKEIK